MENFSKRTQSLLMNAGIKSLQELSEYTAADLLKFRNFGYKSLREVEPYLKTFDFTIKSDQTQIEKLEADKEELLSMLEEILDGKKDGRTYISMDEIESLIKKHKQ